LDRSAAAPGNRHQPPPQQQRDGQRDADRHTRLAADGKSGRSTGGGSHCSGRPHPRHAGCRLCP
jgi:hypothetical protein